MIVVRETFVAKPGQAGKLAKLFKEVADSGALGKFRVLTDLVGDFNTVVLETEAADVAEFERRLAEYGQSAKAREMMKGYTDLYLTGKREVYRIW